MNLHLPESLKHPLDAIREFKRRRHDRRTFDASNSHQDAEDEFGATPFESPTKKTRHSMESFGSDLGLHHENTDKALRGAGFEPLGGTVDATPKSMYVFFSTAGEKGPRIEWNHKGVKVIGAAAKSDENTFFLVRQMKLDKGLFAEDCIKLDGKDKKWNLKMHAYATVMGLTVQDYEVPADKLAEWQRHVEKCRRMLEAVPLHGAAPTPTRTAPNSSGFEATIPGAGFGAPTPAL